MAKASRFAGKVGANSHKQAASGATYGHLQLPKGINMFKEEPGGRCSIDIMPYMVTDTAHPDRDDVNQVAQVGDLWYKRPYKQHRNVGPSNDSAVCPSSIGKKCPICEYRARRIKEGAPDEEIKALRPSARNLYVVIPIGDKKMEEVPHIWDMSQFLFQDMLNEEIEENPEYEVFPDLEQGFTLAIRFSEETFKKNSYAKASRIDFRERDYEYPESILKDIPMLDEVLIVHPYATLEALFFGSDPDAAATPTCAAPASEEEAPAPSARRRKTAAPAAATQEEEEDETPPPAAPARRVRTVAPPAAKEEEEDETPPPAPARKVKAPAPAAAPARAAKPAPAAKAAPAKQADGNVCPHGGEFGPSCETLDECDTCTLWSDCIDAKENS
jgi:hypothetical protein